jgi:hypothetical protein
VQKLRELIREHIRRIFQEMVERPDEHFLKREFQRLYSPDTNFPLGNENFAEQVKRDILFVRKLTVNFKGKLDIYIQAPKTYTYYNKEEKKINKGNVIWIFTSNNQLDSLVFADFKRTGLTQLAISIDDLRDYCVANKKMVLDDSDFKNLKKIVNAKEVNPEKPKEEVIKINNTPYVIDKPNEKIIKKNDRKVFYNAWDVADGKVKELPVDSETKDKILSYLL